MSAGKTSVSFSAPNRDSACDAVVVFNPSLDSEPAAGTTPAACLSCILWSGLGRNSAELITFSILSPGLRPVRRQDTPPERRVPYVQAFSLDDHPAILDTHKYPSRLDGIAEQLDP